ncbi:hypothetical protein DWY80_22275 [Bacteroides ovatus]|nr:hypothetical protein DWY80_22275 [Bacteroides ovatus]
MDSALIKFMKKDYPNYFKMTWDDTQMEIRREEHSTGKFEIRDQQPTIIQYKGNGVSVINNNRQVNVEIVDFENYIDLYKGTPAGLGRKCDFIINPMAGYDFIVFNELPESESQYVTSFDKPMTGEHKEGKRAYAKKQLEISIEKFYSVNDLLDAYQKKIALFSCKLSDGKSNHPMTNSIKAFRKPHRIFSNIRSNEPMAHGFVFEQRIYDKEYKVF